MAYQPNLVQFPMRMQPMTVPHLRSTLTAKDPSIALSPSQATNANDGVSQLTASFPATPRRAGALTYQPTTPSTRRERMPSPEIARAPPPRLAGASSSALLAPHAVAIAASSPVLNGHRTSSDTGSGGEQKTLARPQATINNSASSTALLAGSCLGALITKVQSSIAEKEQEMRMQQAENREYEDLLTKSKEELQQLIGVVSQLHELQLSASGVLPDISGVLPDMVNVRPERPRMRGSPPFFWRPSQEYAEEFDVGGEWAEIVTKTRDFEDQGWVIPVGGTWRLTRGGLYRWTLKIERKCPSRPQMQVGIHGANHTQPWRLVTTSRCSWSKDDEPWKDRPGGDRLIDEGDYVHIEVDLRGYNTTEKGKFALAVNDEPYETFFEDIPLDKPYHLMPVVSMGGDQSRVRLCSSY